MELNMREQIPEITQKKIMARAIIYLKFTDIVVRNLAVNGNYFISRQARLLVPTQTAPPTQRICLMS